MKDLIIKCDLDGNIIQYSDHTEPTFEKASTGTDFPGYTFKWPTTTGEAPNCTYTRQRYLDMLAAKQYVNDKYGWGGDIPIYGHEEKVQAIKKFKDFVLYGKHRNRDIRIVTNDEIEYPDRAEMIDSTYLEGREFPDLIKKVIFSGPCTIVIWQDDSKTIVKCKKGEQFDPEKGIAMAIMKKLFMGSSTRMSKFIKKCLDEGGVYQEEE